VDVMLEVDGLNKRFPNAWANRDVSLTVRRGEIHCLLGENGAGKSTLAECLYGAYRPDSGTIRFKGQPLSLASPREAMAVGIGMVHQHFALAPALSVLENVVVGTPSGFVLDRHGAQKKLEFLSQAYGVDLDVQARVSSLSVGQQQWVEILKALYVGLDLLILDEPTAVLSPIEAERLFAVLSRMKRDGLSVILITHKLDEVMKVSDRVTVLNRGRAVATVDTAAVSAADLARLMVGRDVALRVERAEVEPGAAVLEVEDLRFEGSNGASPPVSFTVREREILGVVGVAGNGQRELFEALVGVRPVRAGRVRLRGEDVTSRSVRDRIEAGVSSIPEDRISEGLLLDFGIDENLVLGLQREPAYSRWRRVLRRPAISRFADDAVRRFEIATTSARHHVRVLSGGNMQKVILARELSRDPACIIASQPTRGLDVGAAEYVRRRLLEERDRGAAVLLISEDLDEVMNLADRMVVMSKGAVVGHLDPRHATEEEVGLLMGGVALGSAGATA
jgi:simple sugar transport system ATP-binding protein